VGCAFADAVDNARVIPRHTRGSAPTVFSVPASLQRRAIEVDGWLDLGCPKVALEKLEPLLAAPGARSAALFFRVRAYVALKQYRDALVDLGEARNVHHDPEWLELTQAWCMKRVGDLAGAAQCMERIIERDPASGIGHFNLGCYLALQGDAERALAMVARACRLDAHFRGAPLDDHDLDLLRGRPEFEALRVAPPVAHE
jgi:tetratricopeptide (TPR) repeat protein